MAKGLILLANGFEDTEAITTIDILRRAKLDLDLVSVSDNLEILTQSKMNIKAEKLLKDYSDLNAFYADLVEGGIPFIQKLLLKDTDFEESTDICVDAVILYEVFVYYKSEIEEGLNGVVILFVVWEI